MWHFYLYICLLLSEYIIDVNHIFRVIFGMDFLMSRRITLVRCDSEKKRQHRICWRISSKTRPRENAIEATIKQNKTRDVDEAIFVAHFKIAAS